MYVLYEKRNHENFVLQCFMVLQLLNSAFDENDNKNFPYQFAKKTLISG